MNEYVKGIRSAHSEHSEIKRGKLHGGELPQAAEHGDGQQLCVFELFLFQ